MIVELGRDAAAKAAADKARGFLAAERERIATQPQVDYLHIENSQIRRLRARLGYAIRLGLDPSVHSFLEITGRDIVITDSRSRARRALGPLASAGTNSVVINQDGLQLRTNSVLVQYDNVGDRYEAIQTEDLDRLRQLTARDVDTGKALAKVAGMGYATIVDRFVQAVKA